jgi:hypothetical protein
MFDMYRPKKKRPVDPNAPPRPNLLNHEKRLKESTLPTPRLTLNCQNAIIAYGQ